MRAIARIIDQWAYDIAKKWFAFFEGDTKLSAICLLTQLGNSEHILADPVLAARYRRQFVAAEDCRPVAVASIAQALQIDTETARRKIGELKARGLCKIDERGVILQLDYLGDSALRHEYENLSPMLSALITDLQTIIVENGYAPTAVADLKSHLSIELSIIDTSNHLIAIIIGKYLARTLQESSFIFGSDRDTAAIYFAIYVENKRLITHDPVLSKSYAWLETPSPQAAKRPVSGNFISRQIGIPPETVRRKVNGLISRGLIERTSKGLLVVSIPGIMNLHAVREYTHLLNMFKSVKRIETVGWLD